MPASSLRQRVLTTSSTKSSQVLTAGMYTIATLATALSVTETVAREMIVSLGTASPVNSGRFRGVEITPFGKADNGTATIIVWQVKRGWKTNSAGIRTVTADFELVPLYSLAVTLGSCAGASGGELIASTELLADTVTATPLTNATTPKGVSDAVEAAYVAVAARAFSPGNNTPGRVWIVDVGGGDILLEMYVGTATEINAVVETVI